MTKSRLSASKDSRVLAPVQYWQSTIASRLAGWRVIARDAHRRSTAAFERLTPGGTIIRAPHVDQGYAQPRTEYYLVCSLTQEQNQRIADRPWPCALDAVGRGCHVTASQGLPVRSCAPALERLVVPVATKPLGPGQHARGRTLTLFGRIGVADNITPLQSAFDALLQHCMLWSFIPSPYHTTSRACAEIDSAWGRFPSVARTPCLPIARQSRRVSSVAISGCGSHGSCSPPGAAARGFPSRSSFIITLRRHQRPTDTLVLTPRFSMTHYRGYEQATRPPPSRELEPTLSCPIPGPLGPKKRKRDDPLFVRQNLTSDIEFRVKHGKRHNRRKATSYCSSGTLSRLAYQHLDARRRQTGTLSCEGQVFPALASRLHRSKHKRELE